MTQRTNRARACALAAGALVTATALAGCGGDTQPGGNVTVTVTPTVTASSASKPKPAPKPAAPTSDDKGRAFEYGTVTKSSKVGDTTVLEIDRWTWKGLDDTKLAQSGVPTTPFKGKEPYTNQNAKLTYTVPVADGARVLVHHCVAADEPLQTKSVDAAALADLPARENTVLFKLDDKGWLVSADNIPGCPK
jgi:hypothetical protein